MRPFEVKIFPDDQDTAIVIQFEERRSGSIEVKFYRAGDRKIDCFEQMIGFDKPFVALRNIFDTINKIVSVFPGDYYYVAKGKRARVYKRYTSLPNREY